MGYPAAVATHLALVSVSVGLFCLRWVLLMAGSAWPRHRSLRIVPHIVDTALLASGAWLIVLTRQYPFVQDWLTLKLLAVVAYIAFGSVALRSDRSRRLRVIAGTVALLTVAWIVLVARARHPIGPLALLS